MKNTFKLITFCLLFLYAEAFPQDFTAGVHSGINLSDIHANSRTGKWKFKPGPYQGVFLTWNVNRILGFTGGLDYSTVYYDHVYPNYPYPPVFYSFSSSYLPPPYHSDIWYPMPESFDYNILSFPLKLQLTIPSTPDLRLSAGVFYSFVSRKRNYGKTSETDFGYLFSSGWSFPLGDSFTGMLNVSYMTGRREITDYGNFRHGSFDFSIGAGFRLGDRKNTAYSADSSGNGLNIVYLAGVNVSWNGANLPSSYSEAYGPLAGFRLEAPVEKHAYFITGITFEKTGYSVKDSSDIPYAAKTVQYSSSFIDTKTSIDYVTIPALFQITFGKKEQVYIASGPYISLKLNARTTGRSFSEHNTGTSYQYIREIVFNDVENLFKGSDAGWSYGAGINFPLFGKSWEMGVQYRRGFMNVFDESSLNAGEKSTMGIPVRNRILSIHLGMKVPAKRKVK